MSKIKYNVGDYVIIEESNIDWLGVEYAGEKGVITECDYNSPGGWDYRVVPDNWPNDSHDGLWCKVKCIAKKTKKTHKYKVGDHVVIEESNIESHTNPFAGKSGTVIGFSKQPNYDYYYLVHPDDFTVDGGIYCKVKCLAPRTDKIVITTDGKTTTATLYENDKKVKSASTKCSPDDKFDFAIGAAIAMDRLYPEKSEPKEEPTPKYLDCKFVLTDIKGKVLDYFTEGKVYTMTDGRVEDDHGSPWPCWRAIHNVDELKDYFEVAGGGHAFPFPAKVIVLKEDC